MESNNQDSPKTDDSRIEFFIPGQGDEYIDISHTMLNLKIKIIKSDELNLAEMNKYRPVNNFIHSLIGQLDIYLNQKLNSPPNNTYPYRSYVETLLNYGLEAKQSHLTSASLYSDKPVSLVVLISQTTLMITKPISSYFILMRFKLPQHRFNRNIKPTEYVNVHTVRYFLEQEYVL